MVCNRGEIWLANLNPSKKTNEVAKTRPVLVLQNNELNHSAYPTTIILPLSSDLIDYAQPLRYRITSRQDLKKDSDILIAHIRSVDNTRFIQKLASLSNDELKDIKELIDEVLSWEF